MSGRSWSNVVAGSLVNHFGGRPSAAIPAADSAPQATRVRRNRCGTSVIDAMPYRNGKRVRACITKNSNGAIVNRSDTGFSNPSKIQIAALHERGNLAIGDGALQHPEPAIRVDVSDAPNPEYGLRALQRPGDLVGCFDTIDLDVDESKPKADARVHIFQ